MIGLFEHDYKNYPELTNSQLEVMQFSSPHKQITADFEALVDKVHDGDTITVSTTFRDFSFPVRLLDIDSPELSEGGQVTRDWLKSRIEGKKVLILVDPQNRVGKYGRLLGKVIYGGLDIAQEEINLGLAVPFGKKKEGEVPHFDKFFSLKQWF